MGIMYMCNNMQTDFHREWQYVALTLCKTQTCSRQRSSRMPTTIHSYYYNVEVYEFI